MMWLGDWEGKSLVENLPTLALLYELFEAHLDFAGSEIPISRYTIKSFVVKAG